MDLLSLRDKDSLCTALRVSWQTLEPLLRSQSGMMSLSKPQLTSLVQFLNEHFFANIKKSGSKQVLVDRVWIFLNTIMAATATTTNHTAPSHNNSSNNNRSSASSSSTKSLPYYWSDDETRRRTTHITSTQPHHQQQPPPPPPPPPPQLQQYSALQHQSNAFSRLSIVSMPTTSSTATSGAIAATQHQQNGTPFGFQTSSTPRAAIPTTSSWVPTVSRSTFGTVGVFTTNNNNNNNNNSISSSNNNNNAVRSVLEQLAATYARRNNDYSHPSLAISSRPENLNVESFTSTQSYLVMELERLAVFQFGSLIGGLSPTYVGAFQLTAEQVASLQSGTTRLHARMFNGRLDYQWLEHCILKLNDGLINLKDNAKKLRTKSAINPFVTPLAANMTPFAKAGSNVMQFRIGTIGDQGWVVVQHVRVDEPAAAAARIAAHAPRLASHLPPHRAPTASTSTATSTTSSASHPSAPTLGLSSSSAQPIVVIDDASPTTAAVADEEDDDVLEQAYVVSLHDPLSCMRIVTPARGVSCRHAQCFDLATYLEFSHMNQYWNCPVCRHPLPASSIGVDTFFNKILETIVDPDDDKVIINGDTFVSANAKEVSRETAVSAVVQRALSENVTATLDLDAIPDEPTASLVRPLQPTSSTTAVVTTSNSSISNAVAHQSSTSTSTATAATMNDGQPRGFARSPTPPRPSRTHLVYASSSAAGGGGGSVDKPTNNDLSLLASVAQHDTGSTLNNSNAYNFNNDDNNNNSNNIHPAYASTSTTTNNLRQTWPPLNSNNTSTLFGNHEPMLNSLNGNSYDLSDQLDAVFSAMTTIPSQQQSTTPSTIPVYRPNTTAANNNSRILTNFSNSVSTATVLMPQANSTFSQFVSSLPTSSVRSSSSMPYQQPSLSAAAAAASIQQQQVATNPKKRKAGDALPADAIVYIIDDD